MATLVTYDPSSSKPLYYLSQIVWTVLWVFEVILGLRFILRMIGANSAAGFTQFVYDLSAPLARPFNNVVASSVSDNSVIEWATLLAMLIYWLVGYAIVKLFFVGRPVSEIEADRSVRRQADDDTI